MFRISRFFDNLFDGPSISSEELRSFTEDHLGKLATHPAMKAATQVVFDAFDDALSARLGEVGSLVGDTATKDQVLQAFRTKIRQRRGRIMDAFAEGTPEYLEIFPQGLSFYTKTNMQNIQQRMQYLVDKLDKFKVTLGLPLLQEFTAMKASFDGARDTQVGEMGQVSFARGTVKTTRTALELQLMDNLLTLAKEFKGQPQKAHEFFNQSKLEDPSRQHPEDNGGTHPPVGGGGTPVSP